MYKSATPAFVNNSKCNVFLRDGTEYLGMDTCPPGTNTNVIGFWDKKCLIIIPNDLIKRVEVYEDKNV